LGIELVSWAGDGWVCSKGEAERTLDDGRDGEGAAQGGVLLAGDTDERLALREEVG